MPPWRYARHRSRCLPAGLGGGQPRRDGQPRCGRPARAYPGGRGPRARVAGGSNRGGRGRVVGIDMPLGLLESGWREADRARASCSGPGAAQSRDPARGSGPRRYQAASQRCRELTRRGFSDPGMGVEGELSRPTGTANLRSSSGCGASGAGVRRAGGRPAGVQQAHRGRSRPAPPTAGPRHRDPRYRRPR